MCARTRGEGMSDDPRLGDLLLRNADGATLDVAVLFFPNDEGVRRNGGRVGAARGPEAFLACVQRTGALRNVEHGIDISALRVATVGDPKPHGLFVALEEQHEQLTARVARAIATGAVPFVIGGGNDQSYANGEPMCGGAAFAQRLTRSALARSGCVVAARVDVARGVHQHRCAS